MAENIGQNMLLITSAFRGMKSFNLIPAANNCPFVECLFDPSSRTLVVITKTCKGSYHMVPKLDDNGDPVRLKVARRENGKTFKEERRMVDTYSEFYISEEKEIFDFLNAFAINAKSFKYKEYFKEPKEEKPASKIITPATAG